ncbi:MAG: hypothetical protein ABIF18_00425, partial [archaeon]
SAVFFGAISLLISLPLGSFIRNFLSTQGIFITAVQAFIIMPIQSAIMGYLFTLAMILVYNFVAKKYPISWELGKK